jgi:alcohol dehydrogenase class IV
MTETELVAASDAEAASIRALVDAYRDATALLAEPRVDAARLAAATARADAALGALRALAMTLGPERLAPGGVPEAVLARWRETAALAAEAARLNAELAAGATDRRLLVARRLADLAVGRRALAGYRPGGRPTPSAQIA